MSPSITRHWAEMNDFSKSVSRYNLFEQQAVYGSTYLQSQWLAESESGWDTY